MKNKVLNFINKNKILQYGDSVILGVSGGADSICMLYLLKDISSEMNLTLYVVHINHHIRGKQAQNDADYVKDVCRKLNVDFKQIDADVPLMVKQTGMTEEEAGRQARYKAFFERAIEVIIKEKKQAKNQTKKPEENRKLSLKENQENSAKEDGIKKNDPKERKNSYNNIKIAVAHNLNDNSETVLFNLFRGTGIKGLTGIPVRRDMIVRPLLCCTRQEIEHYLKSKNISYCSDATNKETEYSRNKIRLELLPYIKNNINKKAEYNIVNAAENLNEIWDYLNRQAAEEYNRYVKDEVLDEKAFNLHPAVLNQVVRKMIENGAGKLKDITRKHVLLVVGLKDMNVSKTVDLPYNLVATRLYHGISIKKKSDESNQEKTMEQTPAELWKQRSIAIAATVKEVASVDEALQYALELCQAAEPHEQLMGAEPERKGNILAAPGLPAEQAEILRKGCEEKGLVFVEGGLREYAGGMEVGVAWAACGLADTGTCVVESTNEDIRLATMLPETSVLLIRRSTILPGNENGAEVLQKFFGKAEPEFLAFISGPSRTADIERVLTLGVHGPLYLHAVLIND